MSQWIKTISIIQISPHAALDIVPDPEDSNESSQLLPCNTRESSKYICILRVNELIVHLLGTNVFSFTLLDADQKMLLFQQLCK